MTPVQQKIHDRLKQVSPSNFKDEAFINQLGNWKDKPMTQKGHDHMMNLMKKYRKQVPDWYELKTQIVQEEIDGLGI